MGRKIIGKQLLIVIVSDLQQLDQKKKPVIYTEAFVEIYNRRNRKQVNKTYKMVKVEKYPISRAENTLNLGAHQF